MEVRTEFNRLNLVSGVSGYEGHDGIERGMVVFRLSPCSECSLCSFGNLPGVRSIKVDVSELNVGSIVLGDQE